MWRRGIIVYIENQSFCPSRRNWVPPTPSPASECVSPLGPKGGATNTYGGGARGRNFDEGKESLAL
jgi:hypothetical protein